MPRVQLIHWNAAAAKEETARLKAAGYVVDHELQVNPLFLRKLREDPPNAVVIDLARRPSQGRDIALVLRQYKSTRQVPLIFVEGDPEKIARIKRLLPDAVYTTWSRIRSSLKRAIAHRPTRPVVPKSVFAAYVDTPLAKKLGIRANFTVSLLNAPAGFRKELGKLPRGVTLRRQATKESDLIVWFNKSRENLERGIDQISRFLDQGKIWIAWPKKATNAATDLTQQHVREIGLAAGLVDYKICAIDETWSGLLFTRRKPK